MCLITSLETASDQCCWYGCSSHSSPRRSWHNVTVNLLLFRLLNIYRGPAGNMSSAFTGLVLHVWSYLSYSIWINFSPSWTSVKGKLYAFPQTQANKCNPAISVYCLIFLYLYLIVHEVFFCFVYFALNEMYKDRVLMVSRTQHYIHILGMSGLVGQLKNLARLGRRVCLPQLAG